MAATATPTVFAEDWALLGATGYQYLVDIHSGSLTVAFASTTPAPAVLGHAIRSGDVVTPPTGMAVYARGNGGPAKSTVTQGNAA